MYYLTAKIRGFWWAAIFYALSIMAHIRETYRVLWEWRIGAGFSSVALIIGIVSGIIVFAAGVWVWKNAEELLLRAIFLCLGAFFLCSSISHAAILYGLNIYQAGALSFIFWLALSLFLGVLISRAAKND